MHAHHLLCIPAQVQLIQEKSDMAITNTCLDGFGLSDDPLNPHSGTTSVFICSATGDRV